MHSSEIRRSITRYLGRYFEELPNAMPCSRYFLVEGRALSSCDADSEILYGSAADILAHKMELGGFFGLRITESEKNVTITSNAKLILLNEGDEVGRSLGDFRIKSLENGVLIAVERIGQKDYLDVLRTPEGFIQSATSLKIEGDLEEMASTIYS